MKRLVLTGDWHMGNGKTAANLVKKIAQKYWKGKPVFLMGDLIDCGLDRGMNFSNDINPQEQIDLVEDISKLIDTRGYVIGNHEKRIFIKVGLNPYKQIFHMLPVHKFSYGGRLLYINHGKSAAENTFLEFTKYAKWVPGDVIALGHSHTLARMAVLRDSKITHFVRTGHLMREPEYGTEAGYQPLIQGWAEYDTEENRVYLKAVYEGKVVDI